MSPLIPVLYSRPRGPGPALVLIVVAQTSAMARPVLSQGLSVAVASTCWQDSGSTACLWLWRRPCRVRGLRGPGASREPAAPTRPPLGAPDLRQRSVLGYITELGRAAAEGAP